RTLRFRPGGTAMEQDGPRDPARFDAFVSYSSADRRVAGMIQRFLQLYRLGGRGALRGVLDPTDMRGGELGPEIEAALRSAATLIVCVSPSAAESRWVAREIGLYRKWHGTARIAVVHVPGRDAPGLEALADVEPRRHDIRPRPL